MPKVDKGKVKMTVIHFETESDNSTLQENIRAIAQTLNRALTPPPQLVPQKAQIGSGNGAVHEYPDHVESVEEDEDIQFDGDLSSSHSPKKKNGARQYPTPETIELDLTNEEKPLKDFLEEKSPDNIIKKYLAIAYWLAHYHQIKEVGMDHAYTCFRHMGWHVPKDAAQPFRALKGIQYGWMKSGSTKGLFTINHIGENEVEKMGQ